MTLEGGGEPSPFSVVDALGFIERAKPLGSRPGIARVARLCALLGDPQDRVPTVHVAGTNGKGSTAAMIASALSAAGHSTGLYASPYIENAMECIAIDGRPIAPEEFARAAAAVRDQAAVLAAEGDPPTSFEIETAIAFLWFSQRNCAAAVIEAGLGGGLDATNVIHHPAVSVITSISYDHTNLLGDTLAQIAGQKCGIIKPGGVTVSYPCQAPEAMDVIRARAEACGNRLIMPDAASVHVLNSTLAGVSLNYDGLALHVPMAGAHQAYNAATAVEALRALGMPGLAVADRHIAEGVARAALPMRQELLGGNPIVLIDGAHNLDKLTALADTMRVHLARRRIAVVMGMLRDKDYAPSIRLIASLCAAFIASIPQSERALPSAVAAGIAREVCADVRVIDDPGAALNEALRLVGPDGAVVVCGSFWLAGPVRAAYLSSQ